MTYLLAIPVALALFISGRIIGLPLWMNVVWAVVIGSFIFFGGLAFELSREDH
jgi:hypothetical protein